MTSSWLVIAAVACVSLTTLDADNAGFKQPRFVRGGWKPVQVAGPQSTVPTPTNATTRAKDSAIGKGSSNVYVVVPTSLLSQAADAAAQDLNVNGNNYQNARGNLDSQRPLQLYEISQPNHQQRQWFVNSEGLHELLNLQGGTIETFQPQTPARRPTSSYFTTQGTPQVPQARPPGPAFYQQPNTYNRDNNAQIDAPQVFRNTPQQHGGYNAPAPAPQAGPPQPLRQPQQQNYNQGQQQNQQQNYNQGIQQNYDHQQQKQQQQAGYTAGRNQDSNFQQKGFQRQPVYQQPTQASYPQPAEFARQPQVVQGQTHHSGPPAPPQQPGNQQKQQNNYDQGSQGSYQNVDKEGIFPRRPLIQEEPHQQQFQQQKNNAEYSEAQKTLPKPRAPQPTTPMYFSQQNGKFPAKPVEQNVVTDYSVKTSTTKPTDVGQQYSQLQPSVSPPSSSPVPEELPSNRLQVYPIPTPSPSTVTVVNGDCSCKSQCGPVTKIPPWLRAGDISSIRQVAADLQADALFTVLFLTEADVMPLIGTTGSYTAFLPSNAGVSRLPSTLISRWQRNKGELLSVLQNHFLNFRASLEELKKRSRVDSRLPGGVLNVVDYFNDTVTINGRLVSYADQPGPYGGLVHVIEGVLYPLANKDIVQTMTDCKRFDGFLTLLEGTQLTDVLRGEGPFTVFAPSNEALTKIPPKDLKIIRSNMTALKDFLLYHVAHGVYYSNDAREGQYITSLFQNMPIQLGLRKDGCYRRLVEANVSPLYRSDIPASNGVIHVVDWVLRPVDLDWCEGVILP